MVTTNACLSGIYKDVQIVLHFLVIFKYCLVLYSMVQNGTASRNVLSELWDKMITLLKWKIFVWGQHPSHAICQYKKGVWVKGTATQCEQWSHSHNKSSSILWQKLRAAQKTTTIAILIEVWKSMNQKVLLVMHNNNWKRSRHSHWQQTD